MLDLGLIDRVSQVTFMCTIYQSRSPSHNGSCLCVLPHRLGIFLTVVWLFAKEFYARFAGHSRCFPPWAAEPDNSLTSLPNSNRTAPCPILFFKLRTDLTDTSLCMYFVMYTCNSHSQSIRFVACSTIYAQTANFFLAMILFNTGCMTHINSQNLYTPHVFIPLQ